MVVEPDAQRHREAIDGPLILREQAEVLIDVVLDRVRQRAHRDLVGHAVVEAVVKRVGLVILVLVRPMRVVHAQLEGVRTGDVEHVEPVVQVLFHELLLAFAPPRAR